MEYNQRPSPKQSGVRMEELDHFNDLEWENGLLEERKRSMPHRRRPVNLSAKIEDYIRLYL